MLRLLLLLSALVAPLVATAAAPLVVYTGRSDQFVRPLAERFIAETGVQVTLHAGSSTELLNKLRVEGSRSPADVYLSSDSATLQIGEDEGLFHALPQMLTEVVPANYRGPAHGWVGLSARARVLVVNEQTPGIDALDSVFDLADPAWRGKLGLTTSANESFVSGLTTYQAMVGEARAEEWLRGIHANAQGDVYPKHGAVVEDVAAGRRAVGLVNHYYVFRHLARHPDAPIRIVVPDQGADDIGIAWNVAGVAIPKHARNRGEAEAFVAFLLSEEGQRLFADANNEYPTRTGVAADPRLPDVAKLKVADFALSELASRRDAAIRAIDKVGMP